MAAQAARAASAAPAQLSIGQVLAKLSPEFPDLTSSKLRFLEERGLITPARTASGYRKFDADDVERLRVILGLQRDHYLPLKVIREYLDDLSRGLSPSIPTAASGAGSSILQGRRLQRSELVREAGSTFALLQEAVSASLLPAADLYGEDALSVLSALVELRKRGIEPRHLRGFRAAAERELGLIETALLPVAKRGDVSSRAEASELAREIADQLEIVRASLIRAALARMVAH